MRDLIGRTLGHYRIVEKIGAGGMGVVYRARDERLDRDVAIKVLPGSVAQDPERIARFEREAKAVAQLAHPNILEIWDFGSEGGVAYAVMELLEGESLRELISKGGITTGKAVEYACAIASGLAVAHEKGIVHRDLKPENVFLTTDGRIKILDFGLAKLQLPEADLATEIPTETLRTTPGKLFGTVAYMAPEQLQGRAADHRSDIFALGIVLYEMLTGRRPFSGGTTAEVAAEIIKADAAPISDLVPQTLEGVLSKCLEKRPQDRFSSAHDLSLILGSVDSKSAAPPSREKSFVERRWPHLAAVIIAAIVALVIVLPPGSLFNRPVEELAEAGVPRIVVLPFENLGSPDDGYFADGMTEEITSRLAAVRGLGVISRTSAMQYKEGRPSIQEIAEELNVDYVLEGTVRWERMGDGPDRVRITPQLIRVENDTHLWSERYDRVMGAVFAVQSEIARQVVGSLNVVLLEPEKAVLDAQPTSNIEAYQTYLLALDYGYRSELSEDFELAISLFERATDLDPQFALAYAALAEIHSQMIHFRYDASPTRHRKALEASDKALELAPNLPEAHRARGYYYYWALRDYNRALSELLSAVDGKPGDTDAIAGIGAVLRRQGRLREALPYFEKALDIDPQNAVNTWNHGYTYTFLREYRKATENIERALNMDPKLIDPYYRLAWTYRLWDGTPERARTALGPIQGDSNPVAIYACLVQEMYERDYQTALDRLRSAHVSFFEVPRQLLPSTLIECECLLRLDQTEGARLACEDARLFLVRELEEHPDDPRIQSALGKTYALLGRKAEAVSHGEEAVANWPVSKDAIDGVFFEIYLAEIYALTDNPKSAIDTLEHLLSIPSLVSVADLRFDPKWDPLRDQPNFRALLEKYDTD